LGLHYQYKRRKQFFYTGEINGSMRLSILPGDKNWTRKKFPPVLFFLFRKPQKIYLFWLLLEVDRFLGKTSIIKSRSKLGPEHRGAMPLTLNCFRFGKHVTTGAAGRYGKRRKGKGNAAGSSPSSPIFLNYLFLGGWHKMPMLPPFLLYYQHLTLIPVVL